MKRSTCFAMLMAAALAMTARHAHAQSALLELPDLSQHARVAQRIGLTDIAIDYHRPLVRGRTIFGGVQAYGDVWRAGANLNTTIAFSDPVTIEGKPLPKGTYGLHFIPGPSAWVVIFSNNSTSWGSFSYDQKEDALRVTVQPHPIALQEALRYQFDDPTATSCAVTMQWERGAIRSGSTRRRSWRAACAINCAAACKPSGRPGRKPRTTCSRTISIRTTRWSTPTNR